MPYEMPAYRPPSESRSLLIRATRGCPWNRCLFCNMYKGSRFQLRPVAEIKEDITLLRQATEQVKAWAGEAGYQDQAPQVAVYSGFLWLYPGGARSAFLGDSNSLILKTDDFIEVLRFLYESFPTLERVTSYGRAKTVLHKTPEELRRLKEASLSRLHVGLESGDDEVLKYMQKGATAAEMIEAGRRVKEARISLSEYVLLGLGGKERWREHALGTARVLNAIDPDFIRMRTLHLLPGAPLYEEWKQGYFQPASPAEVLLEEKLLLENLEVTSEFVSDHETNYLALNGKLPDTKANFLERLEQALMMLPETQRQQDTSKGIKPL